MKVVAFCIRHRVTTIMACVMVMVFGTLGFSQLPLALMPDIELPMAIVYATYNAGPQEVESLVTEKLESACAAVPGMDKLQSVSQENVSFVLVTFADGTDMDTAMTDLRDKLDQSKSTLPDDASSPVVMAANADSMPVMVVALKGSDLASLQTIAQDTVTPALERIDGIASVDVQGGYTNEIAVETYREKLAGYGLSLNYLAQILSAENVAIPAGSVDSGANTLTVRTDGQFASVEDVADCLIPLPAGGSVRLGELANVYRKAQDRATIAKVDGEDCVILSVNKQSGINTVTAARSVQKALDQVAADNPSLDWSVLMDQSDFINLSVNNAMVNIFLGVVLAAAVLFLFLHDWGATLVISLSMPLCIVAVFLMMQVLHITMNIMSLGGVAMGVGMIVDNSIVVLENIFRYRADGADNYTACTQGTGEVALSIIASTLTTVAVFLPLGLTKGIVGMLFYDFCLTICALILMSLVVALTIVPLLCYGLLGRSRKSLSARAEALAAGAAAKPRTVDRLAAWYRRRLNYYITHRRRAMVLTVALVVLFGASIALAGFEMIPSVDQGTLSVTLDLPVGAETTEAELLAERVADVVLKTVPETDSVYYTTGGNTMSSFTGGASSTTVSINLVPLKERSRSADQIGRQLRQDLADIAGAKISVSSSGMMDMSALTGAPIDVTLSGSDYQDLESAAAGLTETLSALPDAADVASSAAEQVPEVDVTIRRDVAARYGLTAAAIGSAARSQLTGSTATTLKVNGEKIDVVIRGEGDTGKSLDNLKSMPVTTPLGSSVPLSMVADIHVVMAPQTINRMNQSRTITITGQSRSGDSAGIAKAVTQAVDGFDLPDGVSVSIGGENSEMIKSFRSLGTALVVALGLVYFVLASQFESFLMPVIVMMILPVSLIGSLSTQVFFGMKISIIAFVGVIMLSGVVVNSSIVLVDYIKTRRLRGEEKNEAILNACPRRVRPVLMTALTTILGLVPMAVGTGEGSELMRSMAVVMISGMVISTVVTLLFTPVYYSLLDGMSQNFADRRKKRRESRVQNQ